MALINLLCCEIVYLICLFSFRSFRIGSNCRPLILLLTPSSRALLSFLAPPSISLLKNFVLHRLRIHHVVGLLFCPG